jgi:hypothetical protein
MLESMKVGSLHNILQARYSPDVVIANYSCLLSTPIKVLVAILAMFDNDLIRNLKNAGQQLLAREINRSRELVDPPVNLSEITVICYEQLVVIPSNSDF